jgi:hypothetical protein
MTQTLPTSTLAVHFHVMLPIRFLHFHPCGCCLRINAYLNFIKSGRFIVIIFEFCVGLLWALFYWEKYKHVYRKERHEIWDSHRGNYKRNEIIYCVYHPDGNFTFTGWTLSYNIKHHLPEIYLRWCRRIHIKEPHYLFSLSNVIDMLKFARISRHDIQSITHSRGEKLF